MSSRSEQAPLLLTEFLEYSKSVIGNLFQILQNLVAQSNNMEEFRARLRTFETMNPGIEELTQSMDEYARSNFFTSDGSKKLLTEPSGGSSLPTSSASFNTELAASPSRPENVVTESTPAPTSSDTITHRAEEPLFLLQTMDSPLFPENFVLNGMPLYPTSKSTSLALPKPEKALKSLNNGVQPAPTGLSNEILPSEGESVFTGNALHSNTVVDPCTHSSNNAVLFKEPLLYPTSKSRSVHPSDKNNHGDQEALSLLQTVEPQMAGSTLRPENIVLNGAPLYPTSKSTSLALSEPATTPPPTSPDEFIHETVKALYVSVLADTVDLLALIAPELVKSSKEIEEIGIIIKDLGMKIGLPEEESKRYFRNREQIELGLMRTTKYNEELKEEMKGKEGAAGRSVLRSELNEMMQAVRELEKEKDKQHERVCGKQHKMYSVQQSRLVKIKMKLLEQEEEIARKIPGLVIAAFEKHNIQGPMKKLKEKIAHGTLQLVHETFVDVKQEWLMEGEEEDDYDSNDNDGVFASTSRD